MSRTHHIASEPAAEAPSAPQLAHELNNLLDGSLRSVELAIRRLRDLALPPEQADAVERLETADKLMLRMAEVIRVWAALPTATPAPRDSFHDPDATLADAARHAYQTYGPSLTQAGVTLTITLDDDAAAHPAGPLFGVIANAIRNAEQAIDAHRRASGGRGHDRIDVTLGSDAGFVELRVRDTGPGLAPAVLDDEGRFRFGITTKPDGHGVGLGVCRQIARQLGGTLTLTNHSDAGCELVLRYPSSELLPTDGRRRTQIKH